VSGSRFGFSKLRIFYFDGNCHAEKIKLKTDPIRIIQRQVGKPKARKAREVTQSMTFNGNGFGGTFGPLAQRLKLMHTQSVDEGGFEKLAEKLNEEDIEDEYEGQHATKPFFNPVVGANKR